MTKDEYDKLPPDEKEHFMKCLVCGEMFNRGKKVFAPLAQLAEQVTLNHWVAGSIPARCIFYRFWTFRVSTPLSSSSAMSAVSLVGPKSFMTTSVGPRISIM